jgi:hypothetical protein
MKRRRTAVVATALLTVGACTSQEAVPDQSSAPTIPPLTTSTTSLPATTTTVAPPPATTLVPDTTVPEPATTPPPTTVAPPSGDPTSISTELFGGGEADGWLYLGRWTGNDWEPGVDGGNVTEPSISDGTDVAIHELDVDVIDGSANGSADACPSGRTGPIISPNARAPQDPGFGYRSIAFDADWPTRPRRVEVVDADVPAYADAGVAAFGGTGIDASGGSISQLTLADLDGDGDTESIVVFDGAGFSALLVIDAQTGESITAARSIQTSTLAPGGGGDEGSPAPIITPNDEHRVLDLVDVNGDGLMEVVAHVYVDAGDAQIQVITYDGTDVDTVLTAGC